MKIYIETEMTELPKSCEACTTKCKFWYKSDKTNSELLEAIDALDNQTRLKNCPLRTETEIAEQYGKEDTI